MILCKWQHTNSSVYAASLSPTCIITIAHMPLQSFRYSSTLTSSVQLFYKCTLINEHYLKPSPLKCQHFISSVSASSLLWYNNIFVIVHSKSTFSSTPCLQPSIQSVLSLFSSSITHSFLNSPSLFQPRLVICPHHLQRRSSTIHHTKQYATSVLSMLTRSLVTLQRCLLPTYVHSYSPSTSIITLMVQSVFRLVLSHFCSFWPENIRFSISTTANHQQQWESSLVVILRYHWREKEHYVGDANTHWLWSKNHSSTVIGLHSDEDRT